MVHKIVVKTSDNAKTVARFATAELACNAFDVIRNLMYDEKWINKQTPSVVRATMYKGRIWTHKTGH